MDPEGKTPGDPRRKAAGIGDNSSNTGYLDGQLLVAMPVMGDPRFERSVIYMCAHSAEVAMGVMVDRAMGTIDILKAIAKGSGPKHAILALGYAGWRPGQLEAEIQSNGWLHCDADPDLVFGDDVDDKYSRALRKIGIDPGMLSNEAGHA